MNVAFVLVSYHPDAPAGMERSVASLCAGLRAFGHHTLILTGAACCRAPGRGAEGADGIARLSRLAVQLPCDDSALRAAIGHAGPALGAEIAEILARWRADVVCFVDALWGLGAVRVPTAAHRVLQVHVIGSGRDLPAALALRPDTILAPSKVVIDQAAKHGYCPTGWLVVSNSLLTEPAHAVDAGTRAELRKIGPIRVLARLGPEKGVHELLEAAVDLDRPVEATLADAGFEAASGSQTELLAACRVAARPRRWISVRSQGLAWAEVTGYLADAGVVIVPSVAETFGLVALEAMSVGTPVVAFAVGNLPTLLGDAGVLVDPAEGVSGLWQATARLLADPVAYAGLSRAGIGRALAYRPATVARRFLEALQ